MCKERTSLTFEERNTLNLRLVADGIANTRDENIGANSNSM